jgi:hypothetical protein
MFCGLVRSTARCRLHRRSKHLDQDRCGTRAYTVPGKKCPLVNKTFPDGQSVTVLAPVRVDLTTRIRVPQPET